MNAVILTRVSTVFQTSENSHSLDQQARVCKEFCERHNLNVIDTLVEVGSGAAMQRPVLEKAMALCKQHNATLVVKSLSRLSRRVAFIAGVLEDGMRFHIVELGFRELSNFELHLYASFSQMEREATSRRVKAGLEQARRNGKILGNPRLGDVRHLAHKANHESSVRYIKHIVKIIDDIKSTGIKNQTDIARCLNLRGIKTSRGNSFTQGTISYILKKHRQHNSEG